MRYAIAFATVAVADSVAATTADTVKVIPHNMGGSLTKIHLAMPLPNHAVFP